jgi:hypothetical protein
VEWNTILFINRTIRHGLICIPSCVYQVQWIRLHVVGVRIVRDFEDIGYLALAFVRVRLVLRHKIPCFGRWPKEHLGDLNPVATVVACEQSFCMTTSETSRFPVSMVALTQLVPSLERRRAVVDPPRENLQQADRDVSVLEGYGFTEVPTSGVHSRSVGPEVAGSICKRR